MSRNAVPFLLSAVVLLSACPLPVDGPVELLPYYELSEEVAFPEGVTFHSPSRSFYVGSLGHGGVTKISADGEQTRIYTPEEEGWTTLGTKLHPDSGALLFCAVKNPNTDHATSALWIFDLEAGTQESVDLLGMPTNCNDLAIDGDMVYISDREAARIHRVDLSEMSASVWFEHELMEPQLIGNNGMVLTQSGALLMGQYAPPRLLRIPLDSPEQIQEVALSGDEIGSLPNGADGFVWMDDALYIAANKRLARLESQDDWLSAQVSAQDLDVGIAAVTVAEGQLYGLKGEIVPFVLGLDHELPFAILALD